MIYIPHKLCHSNFVPFVISSQEKIRPTARNEKKNGPPLPIPRRSIIPHGGNTFRLCFYFMPLSYIFSSHNGARFPNPSERPTSIRFNFILNPTRFLIRSIRRAPSTSKSPQSFFSETELRSVLIHSDLLRNPPRPLISFGAS